MLRATNIKWKETSNFVIQKRNILLKRRMDYDCRVFIYWLRSVVFSKSRSSLKLKYGLSEILNLYTSLYLRLSNIMQWLYADILYEVRVRKVEYIFMASLVSRDNKSCATRKFTGWNFILSQTILFEFECLHFFFSDDWFYDILRIISFDRLKS